MADKKGRRGPVETIDITSRGERGTVVPLRSSGTEKPLPSTSGRPSTVRMPTQEQIAERAWALWVKNGCLPGQHDKNWYEAEKQLKAEMGIR